MLDYDAFHARAKHGHNYVWLVEPLVDQLTDARSLVGYEDHLYLSGLINHMAGSIDEKDALLAEAKVHLRNAHKLLKRDERKIILDMVFRAACIVTIGLLLWLR